MRIFSYFSGSNCLHIINRELSRRSSTLSNDSWKRAAIPRRLTNCWYLAASCWHLTQRSIALGKSPTSRAASICWLLVIIALIAPTSSAKLCQEQGREKDLYSSAMNDSEEKKKKKKNHQDLVLLDFGQDSKAPSCDFGSRILKMFPAIFQQESGVLQVIPKFLNAMHSSHWKKKKKKPREKRRKITLKNLNIKDPSKIPPFEERRKITKGFVVLHDNVRQLWINLLHRPHLQFNLTIKHLCINMVWQILRLSINQDISFREEGEESGKKEVRRRSTWRTYNAASKFSFLKSSGTVFNNWSLVSSLLGGAKLSCKIQRKKNHFKKKKRKEKKEKRKKKKKKKELY